MGFIGSTCTALPGCHILGYGGAGNWSVCPTEAAAAAAAYGQADKARHVMSCGGSMMLGFRV